VKNCKGNFTFDEDKLRLKQPVKGIFLGNLPWKTIQRHTPMFPLEVFAAKRSQESLKK
jgi:hypothetical protein